MAELTDDQLHVALDGLGELLDAIDRDEATPWASYLVDDEDRGSDPKASRDSYLNLIEQAKAALEEQLEADVAGCSCGEADYGAPGHDGGPPPPDRPTGDRPPEALRGRTGDPLADYLEQKGETRGGPR